MTQRNNKRRTTLGTRGVYVIEAVGTDYVKIGSATDPGRRLAELQIGSPHELRLRYSFVAKDAHKSERALHKQFESCHVRGEWFRTDVWRAGRAVAHATGNMETFKSLEQMRTRKTPPVDR